MRRNRGGALAGVAIGVLVLSVLAAVALLWTGVYVAQNVRVSHNSEANKDQVTVETPFGSMRVRQSDAGPQQLGVPVYPGAQRIEDHRKLARFEFDLGDTHKEFAVVAAEYTSADSIEQVRDYYRDRLPHWLVSQKNHGNVQFDFTQSGYRKIVVLKEEAGQTHIVLASVGEPAAN